MNRLAIVAGLGLFFSIGCIDDFNVVNENNPNKDKVVVTPADVENLIAGAYRTFWLNTEDWTGPLGLSVIGDENTSSWGNEGMKDMGSEPRVAFDNSTAYGSIGAIEVPWFGTYAAIAAVNDGLRAIAGGVEIGDDGEDEDRIVAFGKFVQGVTYGFLGSMFDRAYIIDESIDLEDLSAGIVEVPLSGYADVIDAAIGYLEDAITVATGADPFETPDSWVNEFTLTNAQLIEVAHSYIARFMATKARTPAERDGLDWPGIKGHALLGIQDAAAVGDYFGPTGDGYVSWFSDYRWVTAFHVWNRADYKTIGMSASNNDYVDWLNAEVANRVEFDITTDDRRITAAGDPTADGTQFYYAGNSLFPPSRGTYHFSRYGSSRWSAYQITEAEQMETITLEEMDLLIAEAEFRAGNMDAAATLVNKTRVGNGELPAITGSDPDLWAWLKYEVKIETYSIASGLAFFTRRGWNGDALAGVTDPQASELPEGTPIHFPVPAKELEIGLLDVYTFGGDGEGRIVKSMRDRRARRMATK